jgi:hypothetical protein
LGCVQNSYKPDQDWGFADVRWPPAGGHGERSGEFALRDDGRIETEQPRAAFADANCGGHGWRASQFDLRPQARDHPVEALTLQRP